MRVCRLRAPVAHVLAHKKKSARSVMVRYENERVLRMRTFDPWVRISHEPALLTWGFLKKDNGTKHASFRSILGQDLPRALSSHVGIWRNPPTK